jgi:hypothetical protein
MRARSRKYIYLFILLVLAAVTVPDAILSRSGAREYLLDYIRKTCQCNIELKDIRWRWLPRPHIELSDLAIEAERFSARIEDVEINPAVFNTLNGNPSVDNITCRHPFLRIKSVAASDRPFTLPDIPVRFVIEDGRLSIAPLPCGHGVECPGRDNAFSSINGTFMARNDRIAGDISFSSPYADRVGVSGFFLPDRKSYDLDIRVENGFFEDILKEFTEYESSEFALSNFSLEVHAAGILQEGFRAELLAEAPCILKRSGGRSPLISCGAVRLEAERRGGDLLVNIRRFESMSPEFSISGHVNALSLFSDERVKWDIDLAGRDIDLADVRKKLLAVFGNVEATRVVCDIVRGGRAVEAAYRFKGYTEDFQDVKSMLITAVADKVPVMIPEIDLFLSSASGNIRIEKGVLYGWDMDGVIEKSRASGGRIVVGVDDDTYQLVVDFDIDADLGELHEILGRIVPDRDFRDEVGRIHDAAGRARGHMYLGDDFRDFHVDVDVSEVRGRAFYSRLDIPVSLEAGRLGIRQGDEVVSWEHLRGYAGNSHILSSSGSVSWKGDFPLDIREIKADVDTEQLADIFGRYPLFRDRLAPVLTLVSGQLHVDAFSLRGDVNGDDSFHMQFSGEPDYVRIVSPLLPGRVVVERGMVSGDEKTLRLRNLQVDLGSGMAQVSAELGHDWFDDYSGMVEVSAGIDRNLSRWIRKHHWIPEGFYPSVPCYVEKLKVFLEDNETALSGSVLFPDKSSRYSVEFAFKKCPDLLDVNRLVFKGPDNEASLAFKYETGKPDTLEAGYQGVLTADVMDNVFETNRFLGGRIEGEMSLAASYAREVKMRGRLEAAGLFYPSANGTALSLNHASLDANGTALHVNDLQFEKDGEKVELRGTAEFLPGFIGIDVNATADSLHYTRGREISFDVGLRQAPGASEVTDTSEEGGPARRGGIFGLKLFGRGRLHLARFVYNMPIEVVDVTAEHEFDSYILTGIDAEGRITRQGVRSGRISRASMCGFDVRSFWRGEDGNSTLIITGKTEHEIDFNSLMPCLNLTDRLIEGPLELDIRMVQRNKEWVDGWIRFYAHNGRLLRMKLISKIFSVINLVDLFTPSGWQELTGNGLAFSELVHESHIENDAVVLDRLMLNGSGINIFGSGRIMLDPPEYDLVLGISPLQTIDAILTNVPIFGKALGGGQKSFVVIPVEVKGPVNDPDIRVMPSGTVTGVMKRIFDTLTTPVTIFVPDSSGTGKEGDIKEERK